MTTQTKQEKTESINDTFKRIGNIRLDFIGVSTDDDDYIKLKLKANDALKELLKISSINQELDDSYYIGNDEHINFKRFKIKRFVMGSLGDYGTLLYDLNLINNGEAVYSFLDIIRAEQFIIRSKENLKRLVNAMYAFNNLNTSINIKIEVKE